MTGYIMEAAALVAVFPILDRVAVVGDAPERDAKGGRAGESTRNRKNFQATYG